MTRRTLLILMAAIAIATGCTTTPPTAPTPPGEDRYLVDPRFGYAPGVPSGLDRGFDKAWRLALAGDFAGARTRLADLRAKHSDYLPAVLGDAAIDIRQGNLERARKAVERTESRDPNYAAARAYEAEIAIREHRLRRAHEIYNQIAAQPGVPDIVKERISLVRRRLFDELVTTATSAAPADSVRLLREALTVDPRARAARLLLVQKLTTGRNWDEARRILAPLTNSADVDSTDVQAALAEIEVGRGQYEQAIVRYDRLVRREHDPRLARRLDEVKEEWTLANTPPQYRKALGSEEIDRADLAVLLYWKVAAVRFAQNLGTPPIAIDIGEVDGRDEVIRAIALGVLVVDPITRRMAPNAPVGAAAFTRNAARVLIVGGAGCARQTANGAGGELNRAQSILRACGINDPSLTLPPDGAISGRTAAAVFERIDALLSR